MIYFPHGPKTARIITSSPRGPPRGSSLDTPASAPRSRGTLSLLRQVRSRSPAACLPNGPPRFLSRRGPSLPFPEPSAPWRFRLFAKYHPAALAGANGQLFLPGPSRLLEAGLQTLLRLTSPCQVIFQKKSKKSFPDIPGLKKTLQSPSGPEISPL
jgi:hypothetical protein